MALIILIAVVIVLGIYLSESGKTKGFLGVIAAVVLFPIGVILALAKKYK